MTDGRHKNGDKQPLRQNPVIPHGLRQRQSRRHGVGATLADHLRRKKLGQIDLRAWKGHDWEALNRLHRKGMIDDPVGKAKSVVLTDQGLAESERLFRKLFARAPGA